MADVFTKKERSRVMARVRGSGNRSTEWRIRARLVASGASGWRVNAREVEGSPDFAFPALRVAVFLDGCFWHGCRKCRNIPATNREFWENKIEGNRKRDRRVSARLRKSGWTVLRLWEHEIKKDPGACIRRIAEIVSGLRKPAHASGGGRGGSDK